MMRSWMSLGGRKGGGRRRANAIGPILAMVPSLAMVSGSICWRMLGLGLAIVVHRTWCRSRLRSQALFLQPDQESLSGMHGACNYLQQLLITAC